MKYTEKKRSINRGYFTISGIRILLTWISVVFTNDAIPQTGWFPLNSGDSTHLYGVFFLDSNSGYAVGGSKVLRTTNGGTNWSVQSIAGVTNIGSVYFADVNTGYCAGSSSLSIGAIIKTTNSGLNWITIRQDSSRLFYSVFFINSDTGFAGSGTSVIRTLNGGANWSVYTLPGGGPFYKGLHFPSSHVGYIAGTNAQLYKTTDMGTNWVLANIGISGNTHLYSVFFTDLNTGFAAGGGNEQIFKTTDGGNNWTLQSWSSSQAHVRGISFPNANTGYVVSRSGFGNGWILKTTNAGTAWYYQNHPPVAFFESVCFVNPFTGWAVGSYGTILKTTTGGENFVSLEDPFKQVLTDYRLYQNYPNPFNLTTYIGFDLPLSANVSIVVYDPSGATIVELLNSKLAAGNHSVHWDASNVSSGVYLYRFVANNFSETKKLVLLK